MAEKRECEICREAIREKHKNDFRWKLAAIIFGAISVLLIVLFFCSGTLVKQTSVNNEVRVETDGNATNTNIGNVYVGHPVS